MRKTFYSVTIVAFCAVLGACATTPEEESTPDSEAEASDSSEHYQITLLDVEQAEQDGHQSQVSITADCVFVEWCNRPSSIQPDIGTVCRLRTGCSFGTAATNECINETNTVCGAPVQPWWLCRQGASCP